LRGRFALLHLRYPVAATRASMTANKAPAPNRRPRFPLGGLGEFEYLVCAPSASPAAVGEARR
jgi:hypothetical protein